MEHRGPTLGYRIEDEGRVFVYLPTTSRISLPPRRPAEWISGWALAAGADLLFHDSQYTADEYAGRLGWGHSSGAHAAAFARAAQVDCFALFHHDPMRSDRALDELYDEVAELLRDEQEAPLIAHEGMEIDLGAAG